MRTVNLVSRAHSLVIRAHGLVNRANDFRNSFTMSSHGLYFYLTFFYISVINEMHAMFLLFYLCHVLFMYIYLYTFVLCQK